MCDVIRYQEVEGKNLNYPSVTLPSTCPPSIYCISPPLKVPAFLAPLDTRTMLWCHMSSG